LIKLFLNQDKVLSLIENAITKAFDGINETLRDPKYNTMFINIVDNLAMNTQFSRIIDADEESDMIRMAFDGRMYDEKQGLYATKDTELVADYFDRSHPD